MIELHTFPTPNGWKASIALEVIDEEARKNLFGQR